MVSRSGSYRLFGFRGIEVFVHWSWFLVAWWLFTATGGQTWSDLGEFMAIYGSLFAVVLLHEFGHALACRSVGGQADTIVLWPLGGVAYVAPPERPGAVLWSIAAGPLVNAVLAPLFYGAFWLATGLGAMSPWSALPGWLYTMASINFGLLLFNLLPIYPLDGGQIVQSILWFFVGRAKSLHIAATVGLSVAAFAFVSALTGLSDTLGLPISRTWLLVIALFIAWQAWIGYRVAQSLSKDEAQDQVSIDKAMEKARKLTMGDR